MVETIDVLLAFLVGIGGGFVAPLLGVGGGLSIMSDGPDKTRIAVSAGSYGASHSFDNKTIDAFNEFSMHHGMANSFSI